MSANGYQAKTDVENIGSVTAHTLTVQVLDLEVTPIRVQVGTETQVIVRVNGQQLARLSEHRACRLGLIEGTDGGSW